MMRTGSSNTQISFSDPIFREAKEKKSSVPPVYVILLDPPLDFLRKRTDNYQEAL